MNYQKIDAGLAAALDDVQDRNKRTLEIFIRTHAPLTAPEVAFLEGLSIRGDMLGRQMISAKLSVNQINEISDQPWVRYLKLSTKLKPL